MPRSRILMIAGLVALVSIGSGCGPEDDGSQSISPETTRKTMTSSTNRLIKRLDRSLEFAESEGLVRRAIGMLGGYERVCSDPNDSPGNQSGYTGQSYSSPNGSNSGSGSGGNSCEFVVDTDLYDTEIRRSIQRFLNKRIFVPSNVSSNPGESVVYRLKGDTFCQRRVSGSEPGQARRRLHADTGTNNGTSRRNAPSSSSPNSTSECTRLVDAYELRIRATRADAATRLGLFVGPNRIRVGSITLRSNRQAWVLDLAKAREALDYLEANTANIEGWDESENKAFWEELSGGVSGRIRAILSSSGSRQFGADLQLDGVTVSSNEFSVTIPNSQPIASLDIQSPEKKVATSFALPELTASFPYTTYTYEPRSGPSGSTERQKSTSYDVRLHLARMKVSAVLKHAADRLSVDPLVLGRGGTSWLELDGERVVEATRTGGGPLALTGLLPNDRMASIEARGDWTFDTRFDFAKLGDKVDVAQWLEAGQLLFQLSEGTKVVWNESNERIEVRSGQLKVRDTRAGIETTVQSGQCIVDSDQQRLSYDHPIDEVKGGTCSSR